VSEGIVPLGTLKRSVLSAGTVPLSTLKRFVPCLQE
jgi:hypothetical protein